MAYLSSKLPWELAQTKWSSTLNPVIAVPFLSGLKLENIELTAGVSKVINHLLQRTQQGWFLIDNTASSNVWRSAPFNNLTLTLETSADTVVSIWVF